MPLPLPSKSTVLIALALVPVVAPAAYFLAIQAIVSRSIATSFTQKHVTKTDEDTAATAETTPPAVPPPRSIPDEVLAPGAPYVIVCERVVSRPVPAAGLAVPASVPLLTSYLRGTMEAFSWTPQGLLIRSIVSDAGVRRSFDADCLRSLSFVPGDLACGAYQVTYRGPFEASSEEDERVELSIVPIADRPDLVVHGVVVSAVQRAKAGADAAAATVVFVNETWMWRHAVEEKPTMLESAAGRYLHWLVGGWMIHKGLQTVTGKAKGKME